MGRGIWLLHIGVWVGWMLQASALLCAHYPRATTVQRFEMLTRCMQPYAHGDDVGTTFAPEGSQRPESASMAAGVARFRLDIVDEKALMLLHIV